MNPCFHFFFFPLETVLRQFNYAKGKKFWLLRLRQQSVGFPLYHVSAVENLALVCGHGPRPQCPQYPTFPHLDPLHLTAWASQSPCLSSSFLKRQIAVETGSGAMLATSQGRKFISQAGLRVFWLLFLHSSPDCFFLLGSPKARPGRQIWGCFVTFIVCRLPKNHIFLKQMSPQFPFFFFILAMWHGET